MGRYLGPVCRLCRREGTKLFLKGTRCYGEKCAIDRRSYPPGQHGQGRMRTSEYSLQLREKQKLKRIYGLLERQFRGYFMRAERMKGITGENLLALLERRLDNVVYRIGFASSRREARQLVGHGHLLVDGKKVNIPSYLVVVGQTVSIPEKSQTVLPIQKALEGVDGRGVPAWLELDKTRFAGRVKELPTKEDIALPVNEQLVVELYSR
ncbi:MAG: 30S ribosomal protein S4 [Nitrospirae bacterium]|nr:30S ribosomal protein S4 [Nitrospirota bacterium]